MLIVCKQTLETPLIQSYSILHWSPLCGCVCSIWSHMGRQEPDATTHHNTRTCSFLLHTHTHLPSIASLLLSSTYLLSQSLSPLLSPFLASWYFLFVVVFFEKISSSLWFRITAQNRNFVFGGRYLCTLPSSLAHWWRCSKQTDKERQGVCRRLLLVSAWPLRLRYPQKSC